MIESGVSENLIKESILFKFVLFDIRILALSLVLAVANVFIYGRDEGTLFSVLLGAVLFLTVWVFWLLANLFLILTTRFEIEKNEKKQLVELANLSVEGGDRNKNGILVLTDKKMHFKTYLFSKAKETLAYPLNEIKKVTIMNMGFVERFHMEVVTRSKATYLFNIYAGKRWKNALLAQNVRVEFTKK